LKNLVKSSTKRLFICGNHFELYEYEKPFFWNFNPFRVFNSLRVSQVRTEMSLKRARQNLYRLVNSNLSNKFKPLFITFTFKENITNVEIANKKFTDFVRRLNFHYGKKFRYLSVIEFQKRGAVHYHCVFFNLSVSWEELERSEHAVAGIWGLGFVDIEPIRNAKAVAPYVCKYLNKGLHDKRLRGKKSYFTSRGLLRPESFRREESIDNLLADARLNTIKVEEYESIKRGKVKYSQYVFRRNDKSL